MGSWWIGGYGADMGGTGTGIGLAHERADGSLEYAGVVAEVASPSFLLGQGDRLFAAAEGSGRVEAFTGADLGADLEHEGGESSGGVQPCQLATVGARLVVANYFSGSLGVISLHPDGSLDSLIATAAGDGSGPLPEQASPHAHAALALDDSTFLSLDLGADRIHVNTVLGDAVVRTASISVAPGTGPRDIARHESGLIYVLGEFGGELLVYDWLPGTLEPVTAVPLPGFTPGDQAAAIAFEGPFVYVGVRGSNLVSVLRTSADGRTVDPVGAVASGGDWPRHVVTSGGALHVANQRSATIASFRLGADGIPTPISEPIAVPTPTFLLAVG